MFHSQKHILSQLIQLQAGFLITLIIIDKFQHADIPLAEILIHAPDQPGEIVLQFIVRRTVKFHRLLQAAIRRIEFRPRFLHRILLLAPVLLYFKFGRPDIPLIAVEHRERQADPHGKIIVDEIPGPVIHPLHRKLRGSQRTL